MKSTEKADKNKIKNIFSYAIALSLGLMAFAAHADDCDFATGQGPLVYTVPLTAPNITIGADVPVDTIVHRQRITTDGSRTPYLICHTTNSAQPFDIEQYVHVTSTPGLVPGWGGKYAGMLYQTSVPGIGVAVINEDGNAASVGQPLGISPMFKWSYPSTQFGANPTLIRNNFSLVFVKTGPISGGRIDGAQLPTFILDVKGSRSVTGLPKEAYRENFSGSINVIAGTCKTPDVTVQMGSYSMDKYFNGSVKTTPWKPFNITLTDCPAFYGSYTDAVNSPGYIVGGAITPGLRGLNRFAMNIAPTFGAIDALQGIIKLDGAADSARGIGIQLATGDASAPSPVPFNLNNAYQTAVDSGAPGTHTIPMQARYYQTESRVTPGSANSKAVFTIDYY
ncbi:fimbrial protein [Pantoea sp. R102]|uniref:fimbrial protein n=1 Tax=Pantoea sp. R102 TaxID=2507583 RepID=UPI0010A92AC5|nr:fimbrial protein [Pantoea sp. R102]THD39632.1 type 1 fimbrial protein [Pantoea sp. R102]